MIIAIEINTFSDPWMDNGVENFYRILNDLEFCETELTGNSMIIKIADKEKFIKELTRVVLDKRQNLIVIEEDRKTKVRKEVKKDHVIIQEEKKVGGKVALKEEIYKPEKTAEIVSKIFSLNEGKNTCILCGRKYDKSVKKLQQANHPFVTKIASLSGVRSYKDGRSLSLKEYYDNLCPLCYFVGILEWTDEALVYRTFPGERSYLFMPYFENLRDLHSFKKLCVYSGILNNSERYSNIKVNPNVQDVERTPGEYSTLLCFYEKFVENATDEIIARDWAVLHIPFGAVKNVKIDFLNVNEGIIGVMRELKESERLERIYSDLMRKMYFYSQNKGGIDSNITREIQENLSKHFLLDDFRSFTNSILPRKGGYVFFSSEVRQYLEELIFEWRWEKMGVEKEKLDAIKSVGNIVAKISENNASLLYKMDKVRNIEEFWSVLREISRKLPGLKDDVLRKIKPTALDDVIQLTKDVVEGNKDGWKEVRDLIVVYASMYYSLDRLSKMPKGGEEK
ncbi:MAG: hypothetical protein DRN12_06150 [Thermoplasmata archaeon]|nr:MAG: hypothetical protein DRN12_06150 [Thermoplasmata archaeon]